MVKHIILWTLKETDADKKAEILANMKEHLEGLAGKVPGLLEVHVRTIRLHLRMQRLCLTQRWKTRKC